LGGGGADERTVRQEQLDLAVGELRAMGMLPYLERALALESRSAAHERSQASAAQQLTAREREVAARLAEGRSKMSLLRRPWSSARAPRRCTSNTSSPSWA